MDPLKFISQTIVSVKDGDYTFCSSEDYNLLKFDLLTSNIEQDRLEIFEQGFVELESKSDDKHKHIEFLLKIYNHYLLIMLSTEKNIKLLEFMMSISEKLGKDIPEKLVERVKKIGEENDYDEKSIENAVHMICTNQKTVEVISYIQIIKFPKGQKIVNEGQNLAFENSNKFLLTGRNSRDNDTLRLPDLLSDVTFIKEDNKIFVYQDPCYEYNDLAFLQMSLTKLKPGVVIMFGIRIIKCTSIDNSTIIFDIDDIPIEPMSTNFYFTNELQIDTRFNNQYPLEVTYSNNVWTIKNNLRSEIMLVSLHNDMSRLSMSEKILVTDDSKMRISQYMLSITFRENEYSV